jgi:hypothetical protein
LSFYSYHRHHSDLNVIEDLPEDARTGDRFMINVENGHLPDACEFTVHWDNDPPGHRTVLPRENSSIPCIPSEVGGQSAAEPQTIPSLFQ